MLKMLKKVFQKFILPRRRNERKEKETSKKKSVKNKNRIKRKGKEKERKFIFSLVDALFWLKAEKSRKKGE